jgi:hypothetical protein
MFVVPALAGRGVVSKPLPAKAGTTNKSRLVILLAAGSILRRFLHIQIQPKLQVGLLRII